MYLKCIPQYHHHGELDKHQAFSIMTMTVTPNSYYDDKLLVKIYSEEKKKVAEKTKLFLKQLWFRILVFFLQILVIVYHRFVFFVLTFIGN